MCMIYKKVIVKQPKATPLKLTILIHYNYNQDTAWVHNYNVCCRRTHSQECIASTMQAVLG